MSGEDKAEADSRTFAALFGLVFLGLGMLAVTAIVFPNLLGIFTVVGVFAFLVVLQYFLWGRWLGNYLKQQEEAERQQRPNVEADE